MENLIETTGLCKRYEDFSLEGVNLTVPAGTIVGLIGENGAGKTTTLKTLLGMVQPTQGSARLLGRAPGDPEALAQVGVVFEDAYFCETMCAEQIDKVMARVYSNWDSSLFRDYCRRFELSGKQTLKEFSRGMRMKLSLATALAHRPRLLILDEATSGLDPVVRGEILDFFRDFIQDERNGILMSSHITADLEKAADQVAYLHRVGNTSRLLFQEDKDVLAERYGILRCGRAELERLPDAWKIYTRKNAFGCETLVEQPDKVRVMLPGAVCDRASMDEIMQFYAGRESK